MSATGNEYPVEDVVVKRRPQKARGSRLRRRRRLPAALLVMLVVWGVWPRVCLWQAEKNILLQQPREALRWTDLATWAGHSKVAVAKARCLAARRIGEPELVRNSIENLRVQGAGERDLEREKILFLAQSGELTRTEPFLSQLLTDKDHDNTDVSISFLIGYLRVQRYTEAGLLTEALRKDAPEDPFPWYVEGKVFSLQQSLQKAEESFRETIRRAPAWRQPRLELAHLLSDSHRQREAIPIYSELIAEDIADLEATVGLAECFKATGDPIQARTILENALSRGHTNAKLLISLARTEFEDANWQQAAELLRRATRLEPWADDAVFLLAQCERQLGNDQSAAQLFDQVAASREGIARLRELQDQVAVDPANEPLRLEAALLMLRHTNPEDGVVALQAILDQNPGSREAHQALLSYFEAVDPPTETSRRQAEFHINSLQQLSEN